MAETRLDVLRTSVERLRTIAGGLTVDQLNRQAYPSEWTIADVLSHLGSGAVIHRRRLDDILAGQDTPEDFSPAVWAEWDNKTPQAKRTDGLVADAALLDALNAVAPDERDRFAFSMGPIDVDFDGFVGLRLNEHAVHTWDIDVAIDPAATIPGNIADRVVDNLTLIARFTAKPTGETHNVTVATSDGAHGLTVDLAPDAVSATPGSPAGPADLEVDAEALVRLVYGRLDADHTPAGAGGRDLDILRQVFPGP
jgi:uncharacterized protein (TIGR03083 family)